MSTHEEDPRYLAAVDQAREILREEGLPLYQRMMKAAKPLEFAALEVGYSEGYDIHSRVKYYVYDVMTAYWGDEDTQEYLLKAAALELEAGKFLDIKDGMRGIFFDIDTYPDFSLPERIHMAANHQREEAIRLEDREMFEMANSISEQVDAVTRAFPHDRSRQDSLLVPFAVMLIRGDLDAEKIETYEARTKDAVQEAMWDRALAEREPTLPEPTLPERIHMAANHQREEAIRLEDREMFEMANSISEQVDAVTRAFPHDRSRQDSLLAPLATITTRGDFDAELLEAYETRTKDAVQEAMFQGAILARAHLKEDQQTDRERMLAKLSTSYDTVETEYYSTHDRA